MKTEVTVESQYCCPCCGGQSLLRDCQVELFDGRRTWWCRGCRAEFQFEFVRHGLPPGGFQIVPAPTPDPEWRDDSYQAVLYE